MKSKYEKYYKYVGDVDYIDVYKVLDLFEVHDHAIGHAIKKLLLKGVRTGGKLPTEDVMEARDTLIRWLEIQGEKC